MIPAGIYFSIESDNFFSVERRAGCGMKFFGEWKPHWREFPTTHEDAAARMPPWRPMSSAPRNATELLLRIPAAQNLLQRIVVGHWAEMDGSEQPPCKGWFTCAGHGNGFVELPEPTGWMWLMHTPSVIATDRSSQVPHQQNTTQEKT